MPAGVLPNPRSTCCHAPSAAPASSPVAQTERRRTARSAPCCARRRNTSEELHIPASGDQSGRLDRSPASPACARRARVPLSGQQFSVNAVVQIPGLEGWNRLSAAVRIGRTNVGGCRYLTLASSLGGCPLYLVGAAKSVLTQQRYSHSCLA